jgi:uncharacterized protein (DUF2141 family)
MRIPVLFLAGAALVSGAAAQSNPASVEFLPLPESMPRLMFAPDPLAGTLLRPLTDPDVPVVESPEAQTASEPAVTGATGAAAATEAAGSTDGTTEAETPAPPATAEPDAAAAPSAEPEPEPDAAAAEQAPDEAAPAAPPGSTITVIVENVENNAGMVNVAVCDKGLSREGCPYDKSIQAAPGFVETRFEGIAPGTYAVVGYHDENGNDEFDKFLGVPREPYALSSHAAESLVPSFDDAALQIKEGENVVIIRLKRFGGG